jgi:hypothetical protein
MISGFFETDVDNIMQWGRNYNFSLKNHSSIPFQRFHALIIMIRSEENFKNIKKN